MKKNILKIVIGLVLVVALVVLYKTRMDEAKARNILPDKKPKPVKVSVHKVEKGTVNKSIFAAGTVRAVNRHLLYFESKGKVISIKQTDKGEIRVGDRVTKETELAELDVRDLEVEITSYKAQVNRLESLEKQYNEDVKRYKKLYDSEAVALKELEQKQLDLDKAKADLANARTNLKKSEINLERSKIVAPADGVIAYKNIKMGDFINGAPSGGNETEKLKSTPFVLLEDQLMELTVTVPAFHAVNIKPGQKALIFPVIIPPEYYDKLGEAKKELKPMQKFGKVIDAEVYSISPSVDENSRSVEVKIRTKEDNEFRDGVQLSCQIIVASESSLPVVPMKAISFENRRPFCYVVKDGKAVRKNLKEFGVANAEKASVKDGIAVGDLLIIEGKHNLVNGTLVEEVKKDKEDQ